MNNISKVDFSNNELKKIPDSLKDKEKLLLIDFDNNKLTKIPQFIF
jgi:Leucine-rich repeat (LRR) protein